MPGQCVFRAPDVILLPSGISNKGFITLLLSFHGSLYTCRFPAISLTRESQAHLYTGR